MTAALVGAFCAVAAVNAWAVARGRKDVEYVAKPGCMLFLIAAAITLDPSDSGARVALVAALVLSLAGDVFLMLPGRQPGSEGPNLFVAGLGSFLVAHLAFVAAFFMAGTEAGWLAAGAVAGVAVVVFVGRPVLAAVRASSEPALAGPVGAYILVIAAMLISATGTGDALAIAGALSFATSDSLIARERFLVKAAWAPLAIIVTYHLAQALLVLSFAA